MSFAFLWGNSSTTDLGLPTPAILAVLRAAAPVWLAGMLGVGLYFLWQLASFFHSTRSRTGPDAETAAVFQACREKVGVRRNVPLQICEEQAIPVVVGCFRPRILLPVRHYEGPELEAVLTHELVHIKNGDPLFKGMVMLVVMIHWFHPAAWLLRSWAGSWAEYCCDYDSCALLQKTRSYFQIILSMVYRAEGRKPPDFLAMFESRHQIVRRMQRMERYQRIRKPHRLAAIGLTAFMLIAGVGTVLAAGELAEDGYQRVYEATVMRREEAVEPVPFQFHMEHTETDGTPAAIWVEEDAEMLLSGSSEAAVDWTVADGVRRQSAAFYASGGGAIQVAVSVEPLDRPVRVGILTPSGESRYVSVSGRVNQTFALREGGNYRIYVENTSGAEVEIRGIFSADSHVR